MFLAPLAPLGRGAGGERQTELSSIILELDHDYFEASRIPVQRKNPHPQPLSLKRGRGEQDSFYSTSENTDEQLA